MSGKKATKNIKKEDVTTLRHYFPSLLKKFNQCLSKLPEDVKSTDENLTALFRTMWTINMLIKNILGDDAVTHIEQIQVDESCIDMKSTLKEVYKTMWKLKLADYVDVEPKEGYSLRSQYILYF